MKYTASTIIEKPIDEIINLFETPENLHKWMDGLVSVKVLEGVAGKRGVKSVLTFLHGNKETEMLETILEINMPTRMVVTYDSKGMNNIIFSSLEKIDKNRTKYVTRQEFKMHGFMKVIAFLAPKVFKKQTDKTLVSFKAFAESN